MEIKEIRIENLNLLLESNSRKNLAESMGYSDTNYINQICKGHGSFGSATARRIEAAIQLPKGWMDVRHKQENSKDALKEMISQLPDQEAEFIIDFIKSRLDSLDKR